MARTRLLGRGLALLVCSTALTSELAVSELGGGWGFVCRVADLEE